LERLRLINSLIKTLALNALLAFLLNYKRR